MNLSFAGCGFLGIYHVGVASCLKEYAPTLFDSETKISGASAGALVACGLISDCCLGQFTSYVLRVAAKARSRTLGPLHPSFNIHQILHDGLEEVLPQNAHKIATGRLHVSLTRVSDRKSVIVSDFDSREDLIKALLCSSFVPFYSGMVPPSFKGVRYVDGGLSDNLPILDENTITVSPFAGESDICPNDNSANLLEVSLANTSMQFSTYNLYRMSRALFPPHPEVLSNMCRRGFDDALKYLQRNNLINCTRHLSIRSSIVASASLATDLNLLAEESTESLSTSDSGDLVEEAHHCSECKQRQHIALVDTLPPIVVSAFSQCTESMRLTWMGKTGHILSYVLAPWALPAAVVYNYSKRFLNWVPHLPNDSQWFYEEFMALIVAFVQHLKRGRHHHRARLTCQLAISEYTDHVSKEKPRRAARATRAFKSKAHKKHCSKLNIGFSMDFQNRDSTLNTLTTLRHHLIEETPCEQNDQPNPVQSTPVQSKDKLFQIDEFDEEPLELPDLETEIYANPDSLDPQTLDTFDHCLEQANHMEAVMAYYYNEPDQPNIIKVTEIFSLREENIQTDSICRKTSTESKSTELSWDSYTECLDLSRGYDADHDTCSSHSGCSSDQGLLTGSL
ncbi:unnamed protein product [Owenia fusiformis]|uniref:triacylglycerol lipase n=1 Tax=Owenia fusiformis TaxID=6347 RepID=A0A8J1Y3U6_OWEFU|nr:unnamed protein product [Owenia fusiformis]